MKRLWIGVGLLVFLLVSGLVMPEIIDACHEPVVADLEQAAELAMAGRWEKARYLSDRAEESWEEKRPVTASFAEHEPMDEIDGLFAQLEVYAEARDAVLYSGTCVYLSSKLEALGDYHDMTLWNLL